MLVVENILWLLVLIGVMILVHELGHYCVARFFDVRIETFSFGFGPRLWGVRKGETDFRISAIPFGGYVKMVGEQPGDERTGDPRSFLAKPRWQRLAIAFAGPFMNAVLAVALLAGVFMYKYPKPMTADLSATVGHVMPNSPAAQAGLLEGDRIIQLDDKSNPTWEDLGIAEFSNASRPLHLVLERGGKRVETTVTPTLSESSGVGYVGWSMEAEIQVVETVHDMPAEKAGLRRGDLLLRIDGQPIRSLLKFHETVRASGGKPVQLEFMRDGKPLSVVIQPVYPKDEKRWMIGVGADRRIVYAQLAFPEAVSESVRQNIRGATLIYELLRGIVARRMSAKSIDGPIRIAQLSGDAAREGPYTYINLMAAVSLNLAIINLLPIPVLDGGVILLLLFEMLIRRDLSMPVKEAVFKFGFVFLLMIMVFAIYNDITKMILPAG
jgi:regulator of sigma E protease